MILIPTMKWNIVPPIRESIESILQSSADVIMYCFFYTIDVVGMQKGELFYDHHLSWRWSDDAFAWNSGRRRRSTTIADCNSYLQQTLNAIFWQPNFSRSQLCMAKRQKIRYCTAVQAKPRDFVTRDLKINLCTYTYVRV